MCTFRAAYGSGFRPFSPSIVYLLADVDDDEGDDVAVDDVADDDDDGGDSGSMMQVVRQ